jgi:uncharacterized protein DUF929
MTKQKQRQRTPAKKKSAPRPRESGSRPWLPIVVTLVLVATAVVIFILTRPGPAPPPPRHNDFAAELTHISASELDQVGKGSATTSRFIHITESALTSAGKPEVLFIGAEYCPYCAGERWALIIALSRFGSFTGLRPITSSESDIPTFTFHGSSYSSPYLAFAPVEQLDENHNQLDPTSPSELALENKYASGYPFVDFGNRFSFDGATYNVFQLQGTDWQGVINALKQPSSSFAQGILGSANVITAGLCELSGQQPQQVCADPVIQRLEKQLPSS